MDKNILKITDVTVSDYEDVISMLNKKKMKYSRVLLSVDTEIAYAQIIPAPIIPIRGTA